MTDRIITGPGCNAVHVTDSERMEVRKWAFEHLYDENKDLEQNVERADTLTTWVLTGRKPYRLPPEATRVPQHPERSHAYDPI